MTNKNEQDQSGSLPVLMCQNLARALQGKQGSFLAVAKGTSLLINAQEGHSISDLWAITEPESGSTFKVVQLSQQPQLQAATSQQQAA